MYVDVLVLGCYGVVWKVGFWETGGEKENANVEIKLGRMRNCSGG